MALGDRQSYPSSLYQECAAVEADRNQAALSAGKPRRLLLLASFGGLKPGVAVAAQHRSCPDRRQLSKAVSPRQLAAERLVVREWPVTLLQSLPVRIQQPHP